MNRVKTTFNYDCMRSKLDGTYIPMAERYVLLRLYWAKGETLNREQLCDKFGYERDRSVDVMVYRLRRAFKDDAVIRSVHKEGYRWNMEYKLVVECGQENEDQPCMGDA